MSNVIVVETTGNATKGTVLNSTDIRMPLQRDVEKAIQANMVKVAKIAAGESVEDPTEIKLKHCSRCIKMGRTPFHDENDFSLLANGKRHSQCKTCRSEQACEWQIRRKEARKEYQRGYQKTRVRGLRKDHNAKVMAELEVIIDDSPVLVDGLDALFVAYKED